MANKFACMHCGFIFEDPDMEVCPLCGTDLGQKWDSSELRSFVFTELTEEQAKSVATLTAVSTADEILAVLQNDGCLTLENLTPRQVEAYAEFLKREGIPFVSESEEQKAVRLQKQLEAEARAKAALELKKFRQEQLAAEKRRREDLANRAANARRKMIYIGGSIAAVILIFILFCVFYCVNRNKWQTEARASAIADLKVMLRDDPFLTYENYKQANPKKLTLAEYDAVYRQKDYAEARAKTTRKKEEAAREQARLAAEKARLEQGLRKAEEKRRAEEIRKDADRKTSGAPSAGHTR